MSFSFWWRHFKLNFIYNFIINICRAVNPDHSPNSSPTEDVFFVIKCAWTCTLIVHMRVALPAAAVGVTDTSSRSFFSLFFFSLRAPRVRPRSSPALPSARPDFSLDDRCARREELRWLQKRRKEFNCAAQKWCAVTDVQSSGLFQCEFRSNAEDGDGLDAA